MGKADDWLTAERAATVDEVDHLSDRRAIMRTIDDVVTRLRAEFVEMPGLCLTRQQVQRLCGIESTICQMVLDSLVNERFLFVRSDGHYMRLAEEQSSRARVAEADRSSGRRSARAS